MSRQSSIESYFKLKSNSQPIHEKNMSKLGVRKRNLSLLKPATPTKSPKLNKSNTNVSAVIDLCSDDDDIWDIPLSITFTQQSNVSEAASNSSESTVIYSPDKSPFRTLAAGECCITQKSRNSQDTANSSSTILSETQHCVKKENGVDTASVAPKTPLKAPQDLQTPRKLPQASSTPNSSQTSTSKSPQLKNKYFSPIRKKNVSNHTPMKVKRNLDMEMSGTVSSRIVFEDELFSIASEGVDDKTKFLLDIISKCINEPSLKNLLDYDSQDLLLNCLQAVKPGMTLICRLFWRKEGWYKEAQVSQISCKKDDSLDTETLQNMIKSLVELKLLVPGSMQTMTFDDYITVLKREELKEICKQLKLKMASKQTAIEALMNFSKGTANISTYFTGCTTSNAKRVLQMMDLKVGPCYKLSDTARYALHKLYIIMYLGMDYSIIREKKLELVLLYDKIKKETYPIGEDMELDNARVVFRTKEEFDRYLTAHDIYEDFMTKVDVCEKCNIVKQVFGIYKSLLEGDDDKLKVTRYSSLPPWLHRYTPENLYVRILESGIQDLKKDKDGGHYLLALDILSSLIKQNLFRQHRKAEWYAEKALILHNILHRSDEAAEVLLEGFKSSLSEEAKDSMRPRAKKIANQKNISLSEHLKTELLEYATKDTILENSLGGEHIHKQPMERIGAGVRGKMKFETHAAGERVVRECEEYCIYHYLSTGEFTHGEHWEGRIVTSLFFLLFWDIIYRKPAGARGVFLSRFQLYPLDLFTDSFYENRREAIEARLEVIRTASEDKLLGLLQDTWDSRPESELSGFQRNIGIENVKAVARCAGGAAAAGLCARLARRYRYAHSGFPDLTLWNTHSKRIKFIEVKTDSDKPSMKQIQWMQYLRRHNLETEFCYIGVNTTRQRSRINHTPSGTPSKKKTPNKRKTPVKKNKTSPVVKQELTVKTEV